MDCWISAATSAKSSDSSIICGRHATPGAGWAQRKRAGPVNAGARVRSAAAGAGVPGGRANVARMSGIGLSDVAHVAALARLAFSEKEAEAMARDLEQILEHVRSLDALDTEGGPPTAHGFELATPLRPDHPVPPFDPELAVSNAPERQGTAFLVPKVLEEEG